MERRQFLHGLLSTIAVPMIAMPFAPAKAAAVPDYVLLTRKMTRAEMEAEYPPSPYAAGQRFTFKVAATNTGPTTIGDKYGVVTPVYKNGRAVVPGDIAQGDVIQRVGNDWHLVGARA